MVNYQRGKIYKLVCDTSGLIYVGSTTEKYLSRRLTGHRTSYKRYLEGKSNYVTSFEILENDNYYIELIENYPCNDYHELAKRERYYIELLDCVNKVIPTRTRKEYDKQYREDNKEKLRERQKEYYEQNKDKILEQCKQYYEQNKDKLNEQCKQYYEQNKSKIIEQRKQYYEQNKDKKKEYDKQYREQNRDKRKQQWKQYYEQNKLKINESRSENVICECGATVQKQHLSKHKKSKKHINYVSSLHKL